MKNSKKGFSIIFAIGLALISSLLVLYILGYIIPFSKNVKGVENSSKAYYQANSGIEQGLYFFKNRSSITDEESRAYSGVYSNAYSSSSSGSILPEPGTGNSDYNSDYNRVRISEPIQLEIGGGRVSNWNDVEFEFRVPDLDNSPLTSETLSGSTNNILNWQLSSGNNILNSDDTLISGSEICNSTPSSSCIINFSQRQGIDLNGNNGASQRFGQYYSDNCGLSGSGCILKLSVIGDLRLNSNNSPIPYLNWKLDFDGDMVPLRYSRIESSGKSYGYQKKLEIRYPQQTLIEAFDFTVFQ